MSETEAFIPAEVFHASQYIADAAIDRGWSLWTFAERVGALDTAKTVLEYEIYAVCDPDILMGDDAPVDLERVFGISAQFWRNTEALVRTHRDRIAPLSPEAREWYGLDDEIESRAQTTTPREGVDRPRADTTETTREP